MLEDRYLNVAGLVAGLAKRNNEDATMAGRLPMIRMRELVRALAKEGWYVDRTTKHTLLRHPEKPGSVPVPNHPRDEVPRGTLRSILSATGVTPDRLRELL